MRKTVCFMFAITLLFIGCMHDEANRLYLKNALPSKHIDEVTVLYEAPQRPYDVIADFQARNASIKHMRKRAAEIGADAIIVVPVGGWYAENEVWADKDRHSDSYTRLIATALKFK